MQGFPCIIMITILFGDLAPIATLLTTPRLKFKFNMFRELISNA